MHYSRMFPLPLFIFTFVTLILQTQVKGVHLMNSFTFRIKSVHQVHVQASPFSDADEPFKDPLTFGAQSRQSQGGTGLADFFNGFLTGFTSALQGGVAGASTLLNGFGDAANSTFNGLLAGYNSSAQGLIQGVSAVVGNRSQSLA